MNDPTEAAYQSPAQGIFLQKVSEMIAKSRHTGCIDWLPDGKAFVVLSKQDFADHIHVIHPAAEEVGFKRAPDTGAYYHPRFTRDTTFDRGGDDEYPLGKSPSPSNLPPKKRAKWSPPPSEERSLPFAQGSPKGSDVKTMPQLMRTINRQKRKERRDVEEDTSPPVRRVSRGSSFKNAAARAHTNAAAGTTAPPTRSVSRGGSFKRSLSRDLSVDAAATLASMEHQGSPRGAYSDSYARASLSGQLRSPRSIYGSYGGLASLGPQGPMRSTFSSYDRLPAYGSYGLAREYGSYDRPASSTRSASSTYDRLIALKQEELRIRAELAHYEKQILLNRRQYSSRYSEGAPGVSAAPASSKEDMYRSLLGPGKGVCHPTSDSRVPIGEPALKSPAFNRAA
ncbi:hypothetical protein ACHAXT_007482 [Thalassiosira profunda]